MHALIHKKMNTQTTMGLIVLLGVLLAACGSSTANPPAVTTPVTRIPTSGNQAKNSPIATTGCSKTLPETAGTSFSQTLQSGGLNRDVLVHLPAGYNVNIRYPLVLVFHGAGSVDPHVLTEEEQETGFSTLADQDSFIVAYPRSTITSQNKMAWTDGGSSEAHVQDVLFVSDLLNSLQATFCVDAARIYATGFSSGGGFTNILACTLSGRIAAFAMVAGAYFITSTGCHPARPVPIIEFHGTQDSKVPYDGTIEDNDILPRISDWLQEWATRDGCPNNPSIFFTLNDVTGEQWADCHGSAVVIHYRIEGGVHAWPGASPSTQPNAPVATQTIHATTLIWQFFQAHPLP